MPDSDTISSSTTMPRSTSSALRSMRWDQYLVVAVAYIAWASAQLDMAVVPLTLPSIAEEFHVPPSSVAIAVTVTMVMRSVGAIVWGRVSDLYGRKKALLIVLFGFTALSLSTGFANNLATFIAIRAVFGFFMGGEWGIGTAMCMETVPVETRGFFSGTLQSGLSLGFLLASLMLRFISARPDIYNWRSLMFFSAIPSTISFFLGLLIPESPVWLESQRMKKIAAAQQTDTSVMKKYWNSFWILRVLYLIFLIAPHMSVFNITYNMLPTIFIKQHGLTQADVSLAVICQSVAAILGGAVIGYLGQIYLSRRMTVVVCYTIITTVIYHFNLSQDKTVLLICAIVVQLFIAGGQSPLPAHLTELSPPDLRGTVPGMAYNLGQAVTAPVVQIIQLVAEQRPKVTDHGVEVANYGLISLIATAIAIFLTIIMLIFGPENKGGSLLETDVVEDDEESFSWSEEDLKAKKDEDIRAYR